MTCLLGWWPGICLLKCERVPLQRLCPRFPTIQYTCWKKQEKRNKKLEIFTPSYLYLLPLHLYWSSITGRPLACLSYSLIRVFYAFFKKTLTLPNHISLSPIQYSTPVGTPSPLLQPHKTPPNTPLLPRPRPPLPPLVVIIRDFPSLPLFIIHPILLYSCSFLFLY